MEKEVFSGCRNEDTSDDDGNYDNDEDKMRKVTMVMKMMIVMIAVKDNGFNIPPLFTVASCEFLPVPSETQRGEGWSGLRCAGDGPGMGC